MSSPRIQDQSWDWIWHETIQDPSVPSRISRVFDSSSVNDRRTRVLSNREQLMHSPFTLNIQI
jgi:hypothetical protein